MVFDVWGVRVGHSLNCALFERKVFFAQKLFLLTNLHVTKGQTRAKFERAMERVPNSGSCVCKLYNILIPNTWLLKITNHLVISNFQEPSYNTSWSKLTDIIDTYTWYLVRWTQKIQNQHLICLIRWIGLYWIMIKGWPTFADAHLCTFSNQWWIVVISLSLSFALLRARGELERDEARIHCEFLQINRVQILLMRTARALSHVLWTNSWAELLNTW